MSMLSRDMQDIKQISFSMVAILVNDDLLVESPRPSERNLWAVFGVLQQESTPTACLTPCTRCAHVAPSRCNIACGRDKQLALNHGIHQRILFQGWHVKLQPHFWSPR